MTLEDLLINIARNDDYTFDIYVSDDISLEPSFDIYIYRFSEDCEKSEFLIVDVDDKDITVVEDEVITKQDFGIVKDIMTYLTYRPTFYWEGRKEQSDVKMLQSEVKMLQKILTHGMSYKGNEAYIRYSEQDHCYYGSIRNIKDCITFEGDNLYELEEDFHGAVDEYLDFCKEVGKRADIPTRDVK